MSQLLHQNDLPRVPRLLDHRIDADALVVRFVRVQGNEPRPRSPTDTEHDPRLQSERFLHRLQEDPGDVVGIGGLVELGGHRRQRLHVRPPSPQLSLIERREEGSPQRHQPEHQHVEHGSLAEPGSAIGEGRRRRFDRLQKTGGLCVEHHEEQQGMPQRDLQSRAIGSQQGHRHEVEVDEEPERALGPSRQVGEPSEEEAVDQERRPD
jgi:hypothetical protein